MKRTSSQVSIDIAGQSTGTYTTRAIHLPSVARDHSSSRPGEGDVLESSPNTQQCRVLPSGERIGVRFRAGRPLAPITPDSHNCSSRWKAADWLRPTA
jgi:hypothetical protein